MSFVRFRVEGAVGLIELDRPPVNALSAELIADIGDAVAAAAEPGVRAVVITGAPHFAAGADIKEFVPSLAGGEEPVAASLGAVVDAIEALDKPTVAAVRGFALGGGLELAMGCDFRILGESAVVGQPEVGLGLMPGAGGTQRLPRLVGYQAAKDLIMTGRQVAAPEARAIGIADSVVADSQLLDVAMDEAASWAAGPTMAYAAIKRVMRDAGSAVLAEGLARERDEFNRSFSTGDARRGVTAFVEKDTPQFEGN